MQSNTPVLIVGAGPSGLMTAYLLARHGISFRIIDKKPELTQRSNAVALQTRTLEIFKQIGIISEFQRAGQPCRNICFYDKGKEYARVNFESLDSIYKYILALPQAATERILNARLVELQHHIEHARELTDVKMHLNDIEATIKHADGVIETINSQWLIGCDGAHSTVREKCGFKFPGDDLPGQFVVADAEMNSFLRNDQIHIFSASGYMLGAFPIGENHFRMGGNLALNYKRSLLTENDIKEIVSERTHGQLDARRVEWISPFWIHSKMSQTMRNGNVFLIGDAAHIHSPVGGQGMNTGLQDAHNLAWKLALVIQGRAGDKLLDSYQDERLHVIKEIVNTTERMTKSLLIKNPILLFVRKYLIKLISAMPSLNKYITQRMTQLNIRYTQSCAIDVTGTGNSSSPSVGERAPDVKLNHASSFYDSLNDTRHHIICFTGDSDIFKVVDYCKVISSELLGPFKDIIGLHLITPHLVDEPVTQIHDENNYMHQRYNIKNPTIMLIRPDGYIGYKSEVFDIQPLKNFLLSYLQ